MPRLRLVVNADDFGLSRGVDAGMLAAVDAGVVTAVSALPFGPSFIVNVGELVARPRLSVGLHAAVGPAAGEGTAWGQRAAMFRPRSTSGLLDRLRAQRARLEGLMGRPVTHVDAHLHAHALPWMWRAVATVAQEAGVPLRVPRERGSSPSPWSRLLATRFPAGGTAFFGLDLAGRITKADVEAVLTHLELEGVTDACWMVHPGRDLGDHPPWDDYVTPREQELGALLAMADWLRSRVVLVDRSGAAVGEPISGERSP